MTKGTKSILFGVHQFLWHPFTVWLAWIYLNRTFPTWRECVCIVIHDWGYWGKENMDDEKGETHPELGARIAHRLFDSSDEKLNEGAYGCLCLYHSRHYARKDDSEPSQLCWADKYSIHFEPWWFYLPRAWLSGELQEYRTIADKAGLVPKEKTHREWYALIQAKLKVLGKAKRGEAIAYANPRRNF